MIKKLMNLNIELTTSRPKLILTISTLITIVALLLASTLKMDLSWVALAPAGHPAVEAFQDITEEFSTMDNIIVVIESEDRMLLEPTARLVESSLLELDDYVANVSVGIDTSFMLEKGLLYYDSKDIEALSFVFLDPNLDTFIAIMNEGMIENNKQIVSSSVLTAEDRTYQISSLDGVNSTLKTITQTLDQSIAKEEVNDAFHHSLTKFFVGDGLLISPDGHMTMVTVTPDFDLLDLEALEPGVNAIESTIKNIDDLYDNVSVKATGMHVVARDEMASIASDSQLTTILSLIFILLVLYVAFRSFFAPILSFIPLIFGIIWAIGLTALTIGRLNMMTAFCSAMLLGLGIDYAIHMYSSYSEKRSNGNDKLESIRGSIEIAGPGIIVGALTTAAAFFALNISSLAILSELGTVMGTGILTTLASVFWILPALIMLKREKEVRISKIKGQFHIIGFIASNVHKHRWVTSIILIVLTTLMATQVPNIKFDQNLLNLEPEGLASIELMDYLVEKYDISANAFSITVDDLDDVYRLHDAFESIDHVYEVTSVASVIPPSSDQKLSLDAIQTLKANLEMQAPVRQLDVNMTLLLLASLEDNLKTLENNWMKEDIGVLQTKDFDDLYTTINHLTTTLENNQAEHEYLEDLSSRFYNTFKTMGDNMMADEAITTSNLPDNLKKQFIGSSGEVYLISVIPDFEVWSNLDTELGESFIRELKEVDESMTGTPIFMKVLFDSVSEELVTTGLLLFGLLLFVLMLHFRSIKYTLLAFLPLVFTLVFMVGTMALIGLDFNMLNFLAVLLVIGIGIDNGVHILHHYKVGERHIKSLFASIGRAILLTTVTTAFGFGSLMFSSYRGIASLGSALAIGVSYAFVMTVVILPIFLKDVKE